MLNKSLSKILFVILTFFLMNVACAATSEKSIPTSPADDDVIKIGMTVPLTGELHSIGEGERIGVQIYFDKINANGGIGGKKLKLLALDDGYDPLKAASNVHQLIDQDNVFAFMGNMGSAPAVVTLPIINQKKIILFAPVTGNKIYRNVPPDHYIFNFRASLNQETEALVNGVLSIGIKPDEIAFFIQQDGFGQNVYQGALSALKSAGFSRPESLPFASFTRGTLNVEDALARIMQYAKGPLKAFILGGNYSTNAKFIKLAKKEYPNAIFLSVSGRIDPADFQKGEDKNIVTVELVPNSNSNLPAIVEYREDLKKYGNNASPSATSLEGYLSAKLFVKALQKAAEEKNLTTENMINILENMRNVDIGIGINIDFDKNNHQALRTVWPVLLKNEKFETLKWSDLQQKN